MVAKRFLTTAELAEMAGLAQATIAALCSTKKIPAIKKANTYLIPLHAARAFLRVRKARRQLKELTERFYMEVRQ